MQGGQAEWDAILTNVVDRELAAQAIPAVLAGHVGRVVAEGVCQHSDIQAGEADRIGYGSFVAKVRQSDQQTIQNSSPALEQLAVLARILKALAPFTPDGWGRTPDCQQSHPEWLWTERPLRTPVYC